VAIIALLISILLPSLARAREITKRAVCASNLRGLGQGMKVYANENFDWFPIAPFAEPSDAAGVEPQATEVSFTTYMGNKLKTQLVSADYNTVHPSRSLFMLVVAGSCTQKQFVCPSSGDAEDDMRNHEGTQVVAAQAGINRFDFRGYPFVSYGYQVPFGRYGRPNESLDPRMAVGADKSPYFDGGTTVDGWITPDKYNDALVAQGEVPQVGATTASEILKVDAERWRPYNSRNHQQEGQSVMYLDSHVDFARKPIVGVSYDNIYTRQLDWSLEMSLLGATLADRTGPLTQTDSIIVP
jgi:hypothetical protein